MTNWTCQTLECDGDAAWRPRIMLTIPGVPAIPHHYPVVICKTCRDAATVDTFINDELWDDLVAEFHIRKMNAPQRDLTRIEWTEFQPMGDD